MWKHLVGYLGWYSNKYNGYWIAFGWYFEQYTWPCHRPAKTIWDVRWNCTTCLLDVSHLRTSGILVVRRVYHGMDESLIGQYNMVTKVNISYDVSNVEVYAKVHGLVCSYLIIILISLYMFVLFWAKEQSLWKRENIFEMPHGIWYALSNL